MYQELEVRGKKSILSLPRFRGQCKSLNFLPILIYPFMVVKIYYSYSISMSKWSIKGYNLSVDNLLRFFNRVPNFVDRFKPSFLLQYKCKALKVTVSYLKGCVHTSQTLKINSYGTDLLFENPFKEIQCNISFMKVGSIELFVKMFNGGYSND